MRKLNTKNHKKYVRFSFHILCIVNGHHHNPRHHHHYTECTLWFYLIFFFFYFHFHFSITLLCLLTHLLFFVVFIVIFIREVYGLKIIIFFFLHSIHCLVLLLKCNCACTSLYFVYLFMIVRRLAAC